MVKVSLSDEIFAVLTFLTISFFMIGCQGRFLVYFLASYLGVTTGCGYGFLISSMVPDIESANLVIPFFLHPQFLAAMGGNQDLRNVLKYVTFFLPPSIIVTNEGKHEIIFCGNVSLRAQFKRPQCQLLLHVFGYS